MTEEQKEKLNDYLGGFINLKNTDVPPVGAALTDDVESVIKVFEENKLPVIHGKDLENNLNEVTDYIRNGQMAAISLTSELSPKLYNLFLDYTHGNMKIDSKIINPVPKSAKVIFVLKKDLFDNDEKLGRIASSVCRL